MALPNEKEKIALPKFREMVKDLDLKDPYRSDIFHLRWLRARDLNLEKADAMLREYMKWRKEFNLDTLPDKEFPKIYTDEFKYEITGFTEDGCPVTFCPLGAWDIQKMTAKNEKEKYILYCDQMFERFNTASKGKIDPNTKMPVSQSIQIYDFDQYSYRKLLAMGHTEAILAMAMHFETKFPETLKVAFIINAPKIFTLLWNLIKALLSTRTLDKVQVFGPNKDKWFPEMIKHIPLNLIPKYYGGTCEKVFMNQDGQMNVPSEGFVKGTSEDDEFSTLEIEAGQKLNVEYDIDAEGTIVNIKFTTEGFDVGYSLLFGGKEVIPYKRADSHLQLEEVSFKCKNTGKYTLSFDNSYSRMRGKTLHYAVEFEFPEDDEHVSM